MAATMSCLILLVTMMFGATWSLVDNTVDVANVTGQPWYNDVTNACPSGPCFCDASTKVAWCQGQDLTSVPDGLPQDLKHLNLANNYLSKLNQEEFKRFPDLVQLNVSHNQISYISPEAFVHNTKLELLDVQSNQLGDDSSLMMFLCSTFNSFVHLRLGDNSISRERLNLVTLCSSNSLRILHLNNNNISALPNRFLEIFPNLQSLKLDGNAFAELPESLSFTPHKLQSLGLGNNRINVINCSALENLSSLNTLDLGYNLLKHVPEGMCSQYLQTLTNLILSGNSFNMLSIGSFRNLSHLTHLELSHQPNLIYLGKDSFDGLPNLLHLNISHSPKLEFIHAEAFTHLDMLRSLDLSYCSLSWLHQHVFDNLTSLTEVNLVNNLWNCDCDLKWLPDWIQHKENQNIRTLPQSFICTSPVSLEGRNFLDKSVSSRVVCEGPVIVTLNSTLWFTIGAHEIIDCETNESPRSKVTWITPKKQVLNHHPAYPQLPAPDDPFDGYHIDHLWHQSREYLTDINQDRLIVLRNGSLYIDYVTRIDAGNYTCFVENGYGNSTVIVNVRLDQTIFQWIKIYTIVVGFISAFAFFFITVTISSIRYLAERCSSKERKKRKSIHEVLNSLYDFKTVQIDRFCAYKTAKINKLSAFKSDKIHKLVAFKTAKVGKLRTYKQVTMASIFHHMEKMREHYHSQMDKVKDNCTVQVEKLRDHYGNQVSKFKDYKSEKIDRIRDNYSGQVMKIRDYRTQQMNKLRDQYKVQQQHLFKLMELLDIGNCLNVVEAECLRTESMLFNPDISFDLEAQPVHVTRDLDFSDDSDDDEYLTAGSQAEQSDDLTFTPQEKCSGEEGCSSHSPTKDHRKKCKNKHRKRSYKSHKHSDSMSSDSSAEVAELTEMLCSEPPPPPPSFSCELLELDKLPLEELLAKVRSQRAYQDIESAPGTPSLARLTAVVAVLEDNVSTEYESARGHTPDARPHDPPELVVASPTSSSASYTDTSPQSGCETAQTVFV